MIRYRLLILGLVFFLLAILTGQSGEAEAHASLVRSEPPANSQVRLPLGEITLSFTEPLERKFSLARVTDQDGRRVDADIEFDPRDAGVLKIILRDSLVAGFLTVSWETVSTVDGHRRTGSFPLTILNADGSPPKGERPESSILPAADFLDPPRVFTKWLLLASGSFLAGSLWFGLVVGQEVQKHAPGFARRPKQIALVSSLVLTFAGLFELVLQGLALGEIDSLVTIAVDTEWGRRWAIRNVLSLGVVTLSLLSITLQPRASRPLFLISLSFLLGYQYLTASVSHAGAAQEGRFWAILLDLGHLSAASVWIGMLVPLAVLFFWARSHLTRSGRAQLLEIALSRLAGTAVVSVGVITVTGLASAFVQLTTISELVSTAYGLTLLLKVAVVVITCWFATYNAYVLRPRAAREKSQQARHVAETRLAGRTTVEIFALLSILAIAAVLTQSSTPGRQTDGYAETGKFIKTLDLSGVSATLVVDPGEPGENTFEVYLAGAVETVEQVRLNFSKGPGESARLALDGSNPPTFYVGRGAFLSGPGSWRVEVDLRRSTGVDLLLPFEVSLKEAGFEPTDDSSFAVPFATSTPTLLSLVAAAGAFILIVGGSRARPGLPVGYVGLIAARLRALLAAPGMSMVVFVVGIMVTLVLLDSVKAGRFRGGEAPENPVQASAASVERGSIVFSRNCVQCHGVSGRGDGVLAGSLPVPPANLYDHIPSHPDEFFFSVVTSGLGDVMPSFKETLSEEDRWHLMNFLRREFGGDAE